jgi:hypothetical protein
MLHKCEAVQCVVFDARVLFTPEAATKFTKESAAEQRDELAASHPSSRDQSSRDRIAGKEGISPPMPNRKPSRSPPVSG